MAKQKIHLRDPRVFQAPLCCVNPNLQLTENPSQVTCGNCLNMMYRRRISEEQRERKREKG